MLGLEPSERALAPSLSDLIAGSALVAAFPGELPLGLSREELALTEFAFYTTQTYLYESMGVELLDVMIALTDEPSVRAAFASQAAEERRHVEAYGQVVEHVVPGALRAELLVSAKPATRRLIASSIEEMSVLAFCVLESVAMGMFTARHKAYSSSRLGELDRRIALEETRHQRFGAELVGQFIAQGRLHLRDVLRIAHDASEEIRNMLSPEPLLDRFGLSRALPLMELGLLRTQREISARALGNCLRSVRRTASRIEERSVTTCDPDNLPLAPWRELIMGSRRALSEPSAQKTQG